MAFRPLPTYACEVCQMVDICMTRPIKVALADEYTKALAANIREQHDRRLMVVTIPLRQPKALLTDSLHLVLSRMSDREIVRNGWRKIGTD
jgi:hypothetical protein